MQENKSYSTLYAFKAFCPLMVIYSLFALAFVVLSFTGVSLPLGAQAFESTAASRIVTTIAGLLGLVAALIGSSAAKTMHTGLLRVCGMCSILMIALYCVTMVLADGHTNPHAWIILGSTSIIPGAFGGYALRLAAKGWDDRGR